MLLARLPKSLASVRQMIDPSNVSYRSGLSLYSGSDNSTGSRIQLRSLTFGSCDTSIYTCQWSNATSVLTRPASRGQNVACRC